VILKESIIINVILNAKNMKYAMKTINVSLNKDIVTLKTIVLRTKYETQIIYVKIKQ
jgi:hypothetical protein